jgi:transposase-like protein
MSFGLTQISTFPVSFMSDQSCSLSVTGFGSTLSYRDVQELLFERGIDVTYEASRHGCLKVG